MSSRWAAIHGYNHPQLNAAMKTQIDAMSHVMFGGITHAPAIALCRQLVAMTPEALECVFSRGFWFGRRGSRDENGAAILAGQR